MSSKMIKSFNPSKGKEIRLVDCRNQCICSEFKKNLFGSNSIRFVMYMIKKNICIEKNLGAHLLRNFYIGNDAFLNI